MSSVPGLYGTLSVSESASIGRNLTVGGILSVGGTLTHGGYTAKIPSLLLATMSTQRTSKSGGLAAYIVEFDTVAVDTKDAYSSTTFRYTIPVTGYYEISTTLRIPTMAAGTAQAYADRYSSSAVLQESVWLFSTVTTVADFNYVFHGRSVIRATAGDYITGITLKTDFACTVNPNGTSLTIKNVD